MFLLDHGLSTRVADLARASVGSRAYRVMRAEHTYWAGPTSDFFFSSIFLAFLLVTPPVFISAAKIQQNINSLIFKRK